MKRLRLIPLLMAFLLLSLYSNYAWADGGIIRLRQTQGPFVVTIFSAAELINGSPTDISVMVQSLDSNDPILDATLNLAVIPPVGSTAKPTEPICGLAEPLTSENGATFFTVKATHAQASNKLLYAAPIQFNATGIWRLETVVERGGQTAEVLCEIPVGSPPHQLASLFPCLALPPFLMTLFVLNQWLRRPSRARITDVTLE